MPPERKQLPIVGASEERPKRRLPVVQPKDPVEEEAEERPPWHWSVIGAVGILLFAIPLLKVFQALARMETSRLVPSSSLEETRQIVRSLGAGQRAWLGVVEVGAQLVPFALAGLAGGAIVGRFGGQARLREATLAGVGAGGFASLIGAAPFVERSQLVAWLIVSAAVIGVTALAARGGGKLGFRFRRG